MGYRAIGFDYGGVIKGLPGSVFNRDVSALLGVTVDRYQKAYFAHNKKVNRGEVTWEELWSLVLDELGKADKLDALLALTKTYADAQNNQDVLDLVDDLRQKGYKTGLLSNNAHEAAAQMRQNGIDTHFDVFQVSAETGLVKPEPAAFESFASALGTRLSELIFIDDSSKSLSTATECGFTPILFTSYAHLHKALTDLGIL